MKIRFILGLIFIALGVAAMTGIDIGRFFGPVILIAVGLLVLRGPASRTSGDLPGSEQDVLNEVFIFSGTQRKILGKDFAGGKVVAIFSGAELDLSEIGTKEKIINLELVAVFGGIKLSIPDTWFVTSEAVGIIGGMDNRSSAKHKKVELHIKGASVIGGIEITN